MKPWRSQRVRSAGSGGCGASTDAQPLFAADRIASSMRDAVVVREARDAKTTPSGAQVAAEAIAYDRERRTDCNTGRSPPGKVS